MNSKLLILFFLTLFCTVVEVNATEIIHIKHSKDDITTRVREAIQNAKDKDIKLVFEKGIYKFLPEYAFSKFSFITNHGNGYKYVGFRFENFNSVEVEGNGSEFIFHGRMAPFQFENCNKIDVKNVVIDWDIPFTFEAEVLSVNKEEKWFDVKPIIDGHSWSFKDNEISFPNIDGFSFRELGHAHCFDPKTKSTFYGAYGQHLTPKKVEKLENGIYRIHQSMRHYPPKGSVIAAKGGNEFNRYAPAFQTQESKNVTYDNIIVHHALGMAFLFERTEDIKILNSGTYTREGSNRYISSTADATHFANCKGDILVENCRFEGMLDDGTNVHGTYVTVDAILDEYTVRIKLQHFEQLGFKFADVGDEVWFIQKPSPERGEVNEVVKAKFINEKYTELTFKNKLPKTLSKDDILENKTWNPTYTIRNCRITKHRARNLMIKTPKKIVIENNILSSEMSSIGLRGETFFWYESGAVNEVIIRNNHFINCAHGGAEHAVLWVSPRLGKGFDKTEIYDRNIIFEDNIIETFQNRIVWADRLEGLVFKGNTIKQVDAFKSKFPNAHMFDFKNCKDVVIENNVYKGDIKKFVKADESSKKSLKIKRNKGIKFK
ncbi:right-handed parallel beta-helix repeat-containing protein [Flavivirga abyssicola]|uniref:alpha-1,3-galactosidase-related protein n=1 Tax=Flavivirga abyssicola TaxID=3063533 RepID=UPI0026E106C5|nr:right-handed parallel beta-helix repeat-containing protein [Flavivirga sp. MEBiC07777]WVK13768.1 right-handed parallel beta-helix repeat-containing protein [Flavivirga sp. MEBiC07777]